MSTGQLYHYISSKDDVLFLVHRHMQMSWHEQIWKAKVYSIEKPLERLAYALSISFDFLVKNRELVRFLYTESKYLNKKHLRVVLEMDDVYVVGFWRKLLRDVLPKETSAVDIDLAANFIEYVMLFYPMRGWNIGRTSLNHLFTLILKSIFGVLGLGSAEYVKPAVK